MLRIIPKKLPLPRIGIEVGSYTYLDVIYVLAVADVPSVDIQLLASGR